MVLFFFSWSHTKWRQVLQYFYVRETCRAQVTFQSFSLPPKENTVATRHKQRQMQNLRNLVTGRVISKQRQLGYGPLYRRWWEVSCPIFSTSIKICKICDIWSGKLLRICSKSHSKEDLGISVLPLCLGSLCSSDLMGCKLRKNYKL